MKIERIYRSIKNTFTLETTVCRFICAWLFYIVLNLSNGSHLELEFMQNSSLLVMISVIFTAFVLLTVINALFKNFNTDSVITFIFSTLCVFKWLINSGSSDNFLYTLSVIVVYSVFVFYFINKNEALILKLKISKKGTVCAVCLLALFCAVIISVITCLRYFCFSAPNFDFGLFVNMFHNMRESGRALSTSERDVLLSHFVVHISPIYYLILPIYYIFPSAVTLQICQALILASGVVPAYLLCKKYNLSNKLTIILTAIYSLYPALSAGTFYDIHENCFLLPLLLWMFYFFEKEKYPLMYIFAVLTLMVKEDAAIYVIVFALFLILSRKKYLHGALLFAGACMYFIFALNLLDLISDYYAGIYSNASANPEINGAMVNRFDNLIYNESDGIAGAVKTIIQNPGYALSQLFKTRDNDYEKLKYFLQMFLPLGFLPFATKKTSRYILITPILMNLLTDYIYQYDIGFQYHFGISAFLIYASIINVAEIKLSFKKAILPVASVCCICLYITTVSPMYIRYTDNWANNKEEYKQMESILETIPKDRSVAASSMLVAHLADRSEIYQIEYHGGECDTDYVIFDTRYGIEQSEYAVYLSNGYSIVTENENLLILEKTDGN